jgi:hypothetical protein
MAPPQPSLAVLTALTPWPAAGNGLSSQGRPLMQVPNSRMLIYDDVAACVPLNTPYFQFPPAMRCGRQSLAAAAWRIGRSGSQLLKRLVPNQAGCTCFIPCRDAAPQAGGSAGAYQNTRPQQPPARLPQHLELLLPQPWQR